MLLSFAAYLLVFARVASALPEFLDSRAQESNLENELLKRTIPGLLNRRQEVPFAMYDEMCRAYVNDITMCSSMYILSEVLLSTDIATEKMGTVVK